MRFLSKLVPIALLAACDRPNTLVLCHNANCASTANPALDDSPEALRASLDLRWDGRPAIDGIEFDTMWHRASQTCLFEHGPGTDLPLDTVAEAVDTIAAHLMLSDVAWNEERFYVVIELKGYVGERDELHTDAELQLHADCVLDAYEVLVTAATAGNHHLQIVFESNDPRLLDAVVAHPRWPGHLEGDVETRLAGESGSLVDSLREYSSVSRYNVSIDMFEYLAGWATDAQVDAYTSAGIDLAMWSFTTTPDALKSLEQVRPRYVITGEAAVIRRWLVD